MAVNSSGPDSNIWECFIPIPPQPTLRPRMGKGRVYAPKKYREYLDKLSKFMASVWRYEPLADALKVEICFFLKKPKSAKRELPTVKPDIDNLVKAVLDAGNGIIWNDDNQVCILQTWKDYDPEHRVGIFISVDYAEPYLRQPVSEL